MMLISTVFALVGLISNNVAIISGAMLIFALMVPDFFYCLKLCPWQNKGSQTINSFWHKADSNN